VALDSIAWELIDKKRVEAGVGTLKAAGREPGYIAAAAAPERNLGTNDSAEDSPCGDLRSAVVR